MSVHCQQLIKDNKLSDKITVIAGKVEEVLKWMAAVLYRNVDNPLRIN